MRKRYTAAFKAQVVQELLRGEKTIAQIAAAHKVHPNMLSQWKATAIKGLPSLFDECRQASAIKAEHDAQVDELFGQIGRLTTKVAWLKKNLASTLTRNERLAMIEREDDAELSLTDQTQLLSLCRSSIYYKPVAPSPEEVRIKHLIDEIYTAKPFYGSRRIAVELSRRGITIARKTVQRYMREMDIMAVFPGPNLSRRALKHRVFPYLLRNISAGHPNHIWGIDITYIRMRDSWMYLVAIIDWFSRFVVSWELDDTLEEQFVLAVDRALTIAQPLIWNSDQGSHFTRPQYTERLQERGIEVSMDGRGRAIDNIFSERLWRSVRYEEVYLNEYATPREARTRIDRYFRFYNSERPHQSLGYRTPAELYAGGAVGAVNHPDSPLPQLTTTTE